MNLQNFQFQYPWRSYQARVLSRLDEYLQDRKVHIIAPPGSGKTVLGLEIFRRVAKKTLILSPTIAIRNQWKARWEKDFSKVDSGLEDLISTDIHSDSFCISSTYQSLFSLSRNKKVLPTSDVLILDEAHHLRKEWWKVLEKYVESHNPIIIALTATPPWDVGQSELNNYLVLCGDVDEEITIPELVATKDLCPHQDYLHLSSPDESSVEALRRFQDDVLHFIDSIPGRNWIQEIFLNHPYLKSPEPYWDEIYRNPDLFFSLVVFANHLGMELHEGIVEVLESERKFQIPLWNKDSAKICLEYLFSLPKESSFNKEINTLKKELRDMKILRGKSLDFLGMDLYKTHFLEGRAKIQSVIAIIGEELRSLKANLRLVVLADLIRKSELVEESSVSKRNLLGTVPLFKEILRVWKNDWGICHISGSLILVNEPVYKLLNDPELNFSCEWNPFNYEGLVFYEWKAPSSQVLGIITYFLNQGKIQILVGTMSLLGEGWDAPGVNSLVLASSVGSYMLSNQARGRAIRIHKSFPEKVSNIWHLCLVDGRYSATSEEFFSMERRFRAFAGPSFSEPIRIETGVSRMSIRIPDSSEDMEKINQNTIIHAGDRKRLKSEWDRGIGRGETFAERLFIRGWKKPDTTETSSRAMSAGIFGIWTLLNTLFVYGITISENILTHYTLKYSGIMDLRDYTPYIFYAPMVYLLPKFIKSFRDLWVYVMWNSTKKKITKSVLDALIETGSIHKDSNISIRWEIKESGDMEILVTGGYLKEREILVRSLEEIFQIPTNSRYLIKTGKGSLRFLGEKYFPVPEILGRKKESAEIFAQKWFQNLGYGSLVYTRTPKGRIEMFRSKMKSIFREKPDIERGGIWI